METKVCKWCGITIERNWRKIGNWKKMQYCTKTCWLKHAWDSWKRKKILSDDYTKTKICIHCKSEFGRPHRRNYELWEKQRCCSKYCETQVRKQKPYYESARMKLMKESTKFNHKRLIALARDNFTCQICWFREPLIMEVDHKIPRSINPQLENDLTNLWTLCPYCHKRKTLSWTKKVLENIKKVEFLRKNIGFLNELIQRNKF